MSSNPHLKNSGIMDQYKSRFGQDIDIDQMIYFSDMEVGPHNFPDEAPYYPVLWCSTGSQEAPFGKVLDLRGI